jgi:acyl transferase domain-containing protein
MHPIQKNPIAIVGASAMYAGQTGARGFWHDILSGRDLITPIPESHWLLSDYHDPDPSAPDKTYATRGSFLPDVDFDTLDWGIPPSIVPTTDTTQLLALIVAQQVLQDATGDAFETMDRSRVSVILGVTSAQELLGTMVSRLQRPVWTKALREMGLAESQVEEACKRIEDHYVPWKESTFPGLLGNVVAGRIANRLNLGGTNCVTDAACASSFSAVAMGVNELLLGDSDMVITGGADTLNDIFMHMCFSKTPALSPTGECAPFSDKADGTLLGEGIGMVALKRLADAERDGDPIYAVLRGVGTSSDGRSKSVYAPLPEGQANALRRAYAQAGYGPETVDLVEAHGTGTKAGDAAEFSGLNMVFGGSCPTKSVALGTVKSQIGHTKAAAGAAGLFKVVMALRHKVLPGTLKVGAPDPRLDIHNSPFYLQGTARPWVRPTDHPRRASVSSFGFGGSNFHLTLEEYQGEHTAGRLRATPGELFLFGDTSPEAITNAIERLEKQAIDADDLQRLAHANAHMEQLGPYRAYLLATSCDDLRRKASALRSHISARPNEGLRSPLALGYDAHRTPGEVAFIFPGQGSQRLGMAGDLCLHLAAAQDELDEVGAWCVEDGTPLHRIFLPPTQGDQEDPEAQGLLTATQWAQPCLGAASMVYLAALRALGLRATHHAGHSYGELSALAAAGVWSRDAFLTASRARGLRMAEAATRPGAMLAVRADAEALRPFLTQGVSLANLNSPTQTVLSGEPAALQAVAKSIGDAYPTKTLDVATAFHSEIVAPATETVRTDLARIDTGDLALTTWSCMHATPYSADRIVDTVADSVAAPVRFTDTVEAMYNAGVRTFIEVGPGSVLTRLVTANLGNREHRATALSQPGKDGWMALCEGVGELFIGGLNPQTEALWTDYRPPPPSRRIEGAKRPTLPISGTNYGKPYPPPGGAAALPEPNAEPPIVRDHPTHVAAPTNIQIDHSNTPEPSMSQHPQNPSDPWLVAFQEAQRATAHAHATYQQAMRDSHVAYLHAMESSLGTLAQLAGGEPMNTMRPAPTALPPIAASAPVVAHVAPSYAAPAVHVGAVAATAPPSVQRISDMMPAAAVTPAPAAPSAQSRAASGGDLTVTLMSVVADKTGYPADLLNLDMALESDLGIDSIKRVEILSAIREALPGLPDVDPADLARLSTLREIVTHLGGSASGHDASPAPSTPDAQDLTSVLLAVVADKTGYPADLLNLEMALESDLGVDSIKRVEILSAMRERLPQLPEVEPSVLGSLSTLGQIVTQLGGAAPATEGAPPAGK